jgi:GntR family transcriptional regulator
MIGMVGCADLPRSCTAVPTKTQQLIDDITRRIQSGEWSPGTRLPSRTALAEEYGVSTQTVRIAAERLKAAGVIESVERGGYYVRRR